jgi:NAD(P)-dependent dehydrogenase (short-subunit alcohol dehydrogenase family)
MSPLDGRVAIVTGASRGMGSHFVDALVAGGARVACFARASAELDTVAARHAGSAQAFACDVGDPLSVTQAVAAAAVHFGGIDALVNNAAIFHPFRIEQASDEQVRRHVDVNLLGSLWCMRAAIPYLRERKGQVVSISSESVRMPFPYLGVYAATKAAVEALSQALRDELREEGIRVSILRSGSVSGGTGGREWDPAVAREFFATIQRTGHAAFTGDFAEPQSMAEALVALLSLPPDVNVDLMEVRAAKSANSKSIGRSGAAR